MSERSSSNLWRMAAYFDHAASSPMRDEALAVYLEAAALVGNPSSLHRLGQRARGRLDSAREELAAAVGAHPTEVIFTGSGSEANTIAVLGAWRAGEQAGRDRCLVSAVEHPSVAGAIQYGAERLAVLPDGQLDITAATVDQRVALVSVMSVNNETGIITKLQEVAELVHRHGAQLHTDAVQALGHVELDFSTSPAELMSLSAHKIGGPVGIGALLARRGTRLSAVGLGGGQERQLRSGTVPVALAAAFARSASLAKEELAAEVPRLKGLRDQAAQVALVLGATINTPPDGAPHILNITFPGIRADDLLVVLDQLGVHASVGSACKAGVHQPSEVLIAMGLTTAATQSLRFSIGHSTTEADLIRLKEALPQAVQLARAAFA